MLLSILLSALPYALVTAFTPGPNNILALNATSRGGWTRGWPVIAGILSGFFCVMALCAVSSLGLAHYLSGFASVMKYAGAAYIVWLAVHVARSKPVSESGEASGTFLQGFLLQFINVKIILYAFTIYTGYVIPVQPSLGALIAAALFSTAVGSSGTLAWAAAGSVLQAYLNRFIAKKHTAVHPQMGRVCYPCFFRQADSYFYFFRSYTGSPSI